jgi:hypothetical protein
VAQGLAAEGGAAAAEAAAAEMEYPPVCVEGVGGHVEVAEAVRLASLAWGVTAREVLGRRRYGNVPLARFTAWKLLRLGDRNTLQWAAWQVGRRTHGAATHGLATLAQLEDSEPMVRARVTDCEQRFLAFLNRDKKEAA